VATLSLESPLLGSTSEGSSSKQPERLRKGERAGKKKRLLRGRRRKLGQTSKKSEKKKWERRSTRGKKQILEIGRPEALICRGQGQKTGKKAGSPIPGEQKRKGASEGKKKNI